MKILEGRPRSYDKAMDKASKGRVTAVKKAVAYELADADHVLEIGCGTGELAQMLVSQGSVVHGFDMNAAMIEAANEKIQRNHLEDTFIATHMGVDGMDSLLDGFYDAVASTLVFSELSDDERKYAFKHSLRVLKPEGIIVIADEVVPENIFMKLFHKLIRLPMLAVTYLITRTLTTPISNLAREMQNAGFNIEREILRHGGSFAVVTGKRSKGTWDESA